MPEVQRQQAEELVRGIKIPPRPTVVMAVMDEREKDEPDLASLTRMVATDVALSAAVIKAVNSPLFGLGRRVTSVDQAIQLLGLRSLGNLVTGLALRTTLKVRGIERFWDQAGHTAMLAAHLARRADLDRDEAHLFALFRDAGIPLMLTRFANYADTLRLANQDAARDFTEVEEQRHGVNHAVVGYYVAHGWGLPEALCQAILRHHDRALFQELGADETVKRLAALAHLAGYLENRAARPNPDLEWVKFARDALTCLMIAEDELPDLEREAASLIMESGL